MGYVFILVGIVSIFAYLSFFLKERDTSYEEVEMTCIDCVKKPILSPKRFDIIHSSRRRDSIIKDDNEERAVYDITYEYMVGSQKNIYTEKNCKYSCTIGAVKRISINPENPDKAPTKNLHFLLVAGLLFLLSGIINQFL